MPEKLVKKEHLKYKICISGAADTGHCAIDAVEKAEEILTSEGFGHYEVSNYARPGWESLHNINNLMCKSYLGIGAGAHSFLRIGPGGQR